MKMEHEYGTVIYEDKELVITQEPYVGDGEYYQAVAEDDEGEDYLIVWPFVKHWEDRNEGDEANWDIYKVKKY